MAMRPLDFVAAALLLGLAGSIQAQQIFKCTDRQGRTTYSDAPCPKSSARAQDITSTVHACADAECEARRARDTEQARQRLREDKQALAEATAQRRKADAEFLEQMTRMQESRARQAASERTAAMNDPYGYGGRWGYGWGVPGYPIVRPPVRGPIGQPFPQPRPDPMYTSPPVAKNVR